MQYIHLYCTLVFSKTERGYRTFISRSSLQNTQYPFKRRKLLSLKKKEKKRKERERSIGIYMYYTNIYFAMDELQRQILVFKFANVTFQCQNTEFKIPIVQSILIYFQKEGTRAHVIIHNC